MRILITGADGQLGRALQKTLGRRGDTVIPTDLPEFDITDPQTGWKLSDLDPDIVIHSAAMTDVDPSLTARTTSGRLKSAMDVNPDASFRLATIDMPEWS